MTKIALCKKGKIIFDDEKFGIREITSLMMPTKTVFLIPSCCYCTLLSSNTAVSIRKGLCLSKYLILEVTKSFPRKFSHLGNVPFLPHMGLLLLKHMEGIYQTAQLETTRREAEKWGQVATRKATNRFSHIYVGTGHKGS